MVGGRKSNSIILRGFAYPGTNDGQAGYYAVCLDLNLITWRPTLPDAQKSLIEAIGGYLATVTDVAHGEDDLKHLMSNRAPLWPYHILYRLVVLLSIVPRLRRHFASILFDQSVDLPAATVAP